MKSPVAAGVAAAGLTVATYVGHKYNLDEETITFAGLLVSALIWWLVERLQDHQPQLVLLAEFLSRSDLNNDGVIAGMKSGSKKRVAKAIEEIE